MAIKFLLIKKQRLKQRLNKLKEAHKIQDIAAIDAAMTELNAAWTAASEEMYNATQQEGAAQPGAEQASQVLVQEQRQMIMLPMFLTRK